MTAPATQPHGMEIPLYGGRVYFVHSKKAWANAMRWFKCDVTSDDCAGRVTQVNDPLDIAPGIVIGCFDGLAGTVAHECGHATMMTLSRVGIDARNDDGEAFCYLLGWIVQQAVNAKGTHATR